MMRAASRRRKRVDAADVPRPPCASCGSGAVCVVKIEVSDLVLEQDAGLGAVPYWTTSYKTRSTEVEMRLCGDCVRSNVKMTTSVVAEVRQTKKEST